MCVLYRPAIDPGPQISYLQIVPEMIPRLYRKWSWIGNGRLLATVNIHEALDMLYFKTVHCVLSQSQWRNKTQHTRDHLKPKPLNAGICGLVFSHLFSVFTSHVIKTKNRNHSMNEVKNLGYDRWLICKQLREESGLYWVSFTRYLQKCVTQIYRALYGDAMFVSFWGTQTWRP